MNKDEKAKLKIVVSYWVGHNKEHSQEFREWAEKAKESGESEIYNQISQAAENIEKANEALNRALQRL